MPANVSPQPCSSCSRVGIFGKHKLFWFRIADSFWCAARCSIFQRQSCFSTAQLLTLSHSTRCCTIATRCNPLLLWKNHLCKHFQVCASLLVVAEVVGKSSIAGATNLPSACSLCSVLHILWFHNALISTLFFSHPPPTFANALGPFSVFGLGLLTSVCSACAALSTVD